MGLARATVDEVECHWWLGPRVGCCRERRGTEEEGKGVISVRFTKDFFCKNANELCWRHYFSDGWSTTLLAKLGDDYSYLILIRYCCVNC